MGYVYRPASTSFSIYSKSMEIMPTVIPATIDLDDMFVPVFKGILTRVTLDICIGTIWDTSGGNNTIVTPQQIKIWDGGAYRNADLIVDRPFVAPANSAVGGVVLFGTINLKDYIYQSGTYYVRFENIAALGADLWLNGISSRLNFYLN